MNYGEKNIVNREKNIDSLRTLGALFVITLHISGVYLAANMNAFNTGFVSSTSIQIFTRVAVPLFVLISGRYILSNWDEKNLTNFYKRRISKIIIPFISWVIIYGFFRIFFEKSATITSFLNDTLNGVPYVHLWYFFMAIELYLLAPILYKIKSRLSHKAFRNLGFALLIVAFVSEFLQGAMQFKYIPVFYFIDYLGFFITGYTLKDYKPKFNPMLLLFIYLILSIIRGGLALFLQANGNMLWMCMHLSSNPIAIPAAIYLYLFFSNLKSEKNILSSISKYSLGIYAIHFIFVSSIMRYTNNTLTGIIPIDIILYVIVVFSLSLLSIRLLWMWNLTRKIV